MAGEDGGRFRRTGEHQQRMSARHVGRHQLALVPAALLSVAVSAPWGGAAAPTATPVTTPEPATSVPPDVPTDSIKAPASVRRHDLIIRRGERHPAQVSASGIPDPALAAYQRAETVINAADKSCHASWELIAAIGRVESDHGRANGNRLTAKGLATPGIYGIPLDGSNQTTAISDTDAGQYDDDTRWDRAVGPMQFIPSTWSVVGVDGDNDGKRNPQDIDDAALATAVYLCSGDDDLSTDAGRRAAVYRYNHSQDYVDLVLSLMHAYLRGDFSSSPAVTVSYSGSFDRPVPTAPQRATRPGSARPTPAGEEGPGDLAPLGHTHGLTTIDDPVAPPSGEGPSGSEPTGEPTDPAEEPTDPTDEPTDEPTEPDTDEPTEPPATDEPTDPPSDEPTDPAPVTEEEASEQCLVEVGATADQLPDLEALGLLVDFDTCMAGLGYAQ